MEKRGLGRGLSALLADANLVGGAEPARPLKSELAVPVDRLHPNPDQPRKTFTPEALEQLAQSIRQKGIIQPLIVRASSKSGHYEIVAGERRWRAAQLAELHAVPVVVRDFTDVEVLEIAIIENIQREDLNPIEEALAYRQLMDRFGHTQEKLAEALSRSRSHIANSMRLLNLPETVQLMLRKGELTAGHARALITSADPTKLAVQAVQRGLSVRQVEELVKKPQASQKPKGGGSEKDADTRAIESDISANLGMGVRIDFKGVDGGTVTISFRTLDELDLLCDVLSRIDRKEMMNRL
jgi:ParB family chromosome partitioning protein